MNNEPVAWMNPKSLECGYGGEVDWEDTGCIPLYTHPAKTLTDEEIKQLWKPMPDTKTYDSDILKFARAILRKAQEK
jgi:hypothetical protein